MTRPVVVKQRPTERTHDSSMRANQLASSVRNGRKIVFTILDENPIEGYLAGWDTDTYFVLYMYNGELFKELIPKNNILKMTLMDDKTFRDEPLHEKMEPIVRPFRDMVNNTYFSKQEAER